MAFGNRTGLSNAAPKADIAFPADATDTVQAIRWSPTAHCLAAASWDGKVRIYNVANNGAGISPVAMISSEGPVFSCDFSKDGAIVAAGGADKKAHLLDSSSGKTFSFDAHAAPISAVRFVNIPASSSPILATGSWDRTLRYWDLRQTSQPVATVNVGERIYSMDSASDVLAITTADPTRVQLIDLKTNPAMVAPAASKLSFQSRFVSVSEDGKHWAVGGIEGRCSAASTDKLEAKKFDFSWRCHREPQAALRKDPAKVWTVNDGAYHPSKNHIFVTGGGDGEINFWDLTSHSRLKRLSNLGIVTAVAFSRDGAYLAYATGYDWSKGYSENNQEKYPTKLFLHSVAADELRKS